VSLKRALTTSSNVRGLQKIKSVSRFEPPQSLTDRSN